MTSSSSQLHICGGFKTFGFPFFREKNFPTNHDDDGVRVKWIACGAEHAVIVSENNEVWGIGRNADYQLGLPHGEDVLELHLLKDAPFSGQAIKSVSCGPYTTFVATESGDLWVAGSNNYGQLGLGHNQEQTEFTKVPIDAQSIDAVSLGHFHSVILINQNQLWACGSSTDGQLGLGDYEEQHSFKRVNGETSVLFEKNITQIACGGYHTVLLTDENDLYQAGRYYSDDLGFWVTDKLNTFQQILISTVIKDIKCGWFHTVLLSEDNHVLTFGQNEDGELGHPYDSALSYPQQADIRIPSAANSVERLCMSSPSSTTVVVLDNGQIMATGQNEFGQLGFADSRKRKEFEVVPFVKKPGTVITQVVSGGFIMVVVVHPEM